MLRRTPAGDKGFQREHGSVPPRPNGGPEGIERHARASREVDANILLFGDGAWVLKALDLSHLGKHRSQPLERVRSIDENHNLT
jgi:hypothetical protein